MGALIPDGNRMLLDTAAQASGILTHDKRLKVLSREGLHVWLFDDFPG